MRKKKEYKKINDFSKTIVDMWENNRITYLISIDDSNTLYITERSSEVRK
jgi:hypothetical protein